jgi:hypothetical protein
MALRDWIEADEPPEPEVRNQRIREDISRQVAERVASTPDLGLRASLFGEDAATETLSQRIRHEMVGDLVGRVAGDIRRPYGDVWPQLSAEIKDHYGVDPEPYREHTSQLRQLASRAAQYQSALEGARSIASEELRVRREANFVPIVSAIVSTQQAAAVRAAAERIREGKENPDDYYTVARYQALQELQGNSSFGGRLVDLLGSATSMGGEFALGGGLFAGGRAATALGVRAAVRRALAQVSVNIAAQGTAGYHRERIPGMSTGGETLEVGETPSVGRALYRGVGGAAIEAGSELVGGVLTRIPGVRRLSPSPNNLMRRVGFHGILGEMLEERFSDVAQGLARTKDDYGVFSAKNVGEAMEQIGLEFVGFGLMGVTMGGQGWGMVNRVLGRNLPSGGPPLMQVPPLDPLVSPTAVDRQGRNIAEKHKDVTRMVRERNQRAVEEWIVNTPAAELRRFQGFYGIDETTIALKEAEEKAKREGDEVEAFKKQGELHSRGRVIRDAMEADIEQAKATITEVAKEVEGPSLVATTVEQPPSQIGTPQEAVPEPQGPTQTPEVAQTPIGAPGTIPGATEAAFVREPAGVQPSTVPEGMSEEFWGRLKAEFATGDSRARTYFADMVKSHPDFKGQVDPEGVEAQAAKRAADRAAGDPLRRTVRQVVESIWPDAQHEGDESQVDYAGRSIQITVNHEDRAIGVAFSQDPSEVEQSAKGESMPARSIAKTLQRGTMALARKLKELTSRAKTAGLKVEYDAPDERRGRIYKKQIAKIGAPGTIPGAEPARQRIVLGPEKESERRRLKSGKKSVETLRERVLQMGGIRAEDIEAHLGRPPAELGLLQYVGTQRLDQVAKSLSTPAPEGEGFLTVPPGEHETGYLLRQLQTNPTMTREGPAEDELARDERRANARQEQLRRELADAGHAEEARRVETAEFQKGFPRGFQDAADNPDADPGQFLEGEEVGDFDPAAFDAPAAEQVTLPPAAAKVLGERIDDISALWKMVEEKRKASYATLEKESEADLIEPGVETKTTREELPALTREAIADPEVERVAQKIIKGVSVDVETKLLAKLTPEQVRLVTQALDAEVEVLKANAARQPSREWTAKEGGEEAQRKPRGRGGKPGRQAFDPKAPIPEPTADPNDPASQVPIGEAEVIKSLERLFDVKIQLGRIRLRAAGVYHFKPELVRIRGRYARFIGVAAHAVAHHLDKKNGLSSHANLSPQAIAELEALDYDPKLARPDEGFAEYIRIRLTQGNAAAAAAAPAFHNFFSAWLPSNLAAERSMREARDIIVRWAKQTPAHKVMGQIFPVGERPFALGVPMAERMRIMTNSAQVRAYTRYKWAGYPIDLAVKEAAKRGVTLSAAMDPAQLRLYFLSSGSAFAETALQNGVFDPLTMEKMGPGWKDVVSDKDGKRRIEAKHMDEFAAFLVARHQHLDMEPLGQEGPVDHETAKEAYEEILARFPQWEEAAAVFTEMNNSLRRLEEKWGLIAPGTAQLWAEKYPHFAPMERAIDEKGPNKFRPTFLDLSAAAKRRKGKSTRPVVNPIDVMFQRYIEGYERLGRHRVVTAFVDMVEATEGMGKWAFSVPPAMVPTTFNIEEIKKQLTDHGMAEDAFDPIVKADLAAAFPAEVAGIPTFDTMPLDVAIEAIANALPMGNRGRVVSVAEFALNNKALAVWRPDLFRAREPNSATIWRNGERVLYRFDPMVFEALGVVEQKHLHIFMRIAHWFGKWFRLGATGLNWMFAPKNAVRDFGTFLMQQQGKKSSATAVLDPWRALAGIVGHGIGLQTKNPYQGLWEKAGGKMTNLLATDKAGIQNIVRKITGRKGNILNEGVYYFRNTVDALRDGLSVTESAARVAEFRNILEAHGWTIDKLQAGQVPPPEFIVQARVAADDVTVNFRRMGSAMQGWGTLIPFLNAQLESIDKMRRTFKDNPLPMVIRSAALAAATLAYWMKIKDEDWYKGAEPWVKYGFWHIVDEDGKPIIRIPRPFEWGWLISANIEAAADALYRSDASYFKDYIPEMAHAVFPKFKPVFTPAVEAYFNYDTFTQRQVVPEWMQHRSRRDQAHPWTPGIWKVLASVSPWDVSPLALEHAVDGMFGGLPNRVWSVASTEAFTSPYPTRTPLLGGFLFGQDYERFTRQFYNQLENARQTVGSARLAGNATPDMLARQYRLNLVSSLFSGQGDVDGLRDLIPQGSRDRESRFRIERYIAGGSAWATGGERLDRYPNPLAPTVEDADVRGVRDRIIQRALNEATNSPVPERERGESAESFARRRAEREADIARATAFIADLRGLGWNNDDLRRVLVAGLRRRGFSATAITPRVSRLR